MSKLCRPDRDTTPTVSHSTAPALVLLGSDPALLAAVAPAVDALMVDHEGVDKQARQRGYDTEINTPCDRQLERIQSLHPREVIVRIPPWQHPDRPDRLARALDCGVDTVMLPMADRVADVDAFLRAIDGRARGIVQLETPELLADIRALRELPWAHLYLGLNDLMIARGDRSLFRPLVDGTVDHLSNALAPRRVGFAGLTAIDRGDPVPTLELMAVMVAVGCSMTLLRRSFARDLQPADAAGAIAALRTGFARLAADPSHVATLRARLHARVHALTRRP